MFENISGFNFSNGKKIRNAKKTEKKKKKKKKKVFFSFSCDGKRERERREKREREYRTESLKESCARERETRRRREEEEKKRMVVPAGAVIGAVLGAAFATEAGRRGRNEEKKERENQVAELQKSLELEIEKVTSLECQVKEQLTASELLEKARVALEKKIEVLEKSLSVKSKEAKEATESREKLINCLKTRVKSVLDNISKSSMDKQVLTNILSKLLDEELLSDRPVVTKPVLASPNRLLKLGSKKREAAKQQQRGFRIPFFSHNMNTTTKKVSA